MQFHAKTFDQLTTRELFDLIQARLAVFVVEQNCVYQDLDDRDLQALHLWLESDGKLLAYLRIFPIAESTLRIGRVLTLERGKGYGAAILQESLCLCREFFHAHTVEVEAQSYAAGFYEKASFQVCSEEFLEDGIPHVKMRMEIA